MCAYGSLLNLTHVGSHFTLDTIHGHHNLFPIPTQRSPPLHLSSSLISFGSDIYNIGVSRKEKHSSRVWILDCRSHTWRKAPKMLVKRKSPCVRVLDGKIYVRGSQRVYNSSSPWVEVFDPKTQTWEPWEYKSEIKFRDPRPRCPCYRLNTLDPSDYKWNVEFVRPRRELHWDFSCYCMIEDVIYGYGEGVFKWYDTKVKRSSWTNLEGLPDKIAESSFVKLVNYGGKIAVLWDKSVPSSSGNDEKNRVIHCAVIALERRNDNEIYGSVEWIVMPCLQFLSLTNL